MLGQVKTINNVKQIVPLTADTGSGNPIGTILPLYKKSTPNGYLYCDGSTFDTTAYPGLYAYLGTNVLPDYREFALVGAEENTTDVYNATTNPNGTIHDHDVYSQGEAKDDQLQEHSHWSNTASGGSTAILLQGNGGNTRGTNVVTDYGVRVGTVTRGKRKAVYFYIKATTGLDENQQDYVLDTLNDTLRQQRSYSTDEHLTGKYWIDGKPIYSKTVYVTSTASGTLDLSSMNIDTPISVVNAVAYKYNGVTNKQALPLLSDQIRGGVTFQQIQLIVSKGVATYEYDDVYVTLEYTKTT